MNHSKNTYGILKAGLKYTLKARFVVSVVSSVRNTATKLVISRKPKVVGVEPGVDHLRPSLHLPVNSSRPATLRPIIHHFPFTRHPKSFTIRTVLAVLAVTFVLPLFLTTSDLPLTTTVAQAQTPNTTLNFQARILMASGALVPDGNYNLEFKIYDSSASGATAQGVCSLNSSTDDCWWLETRTGANVVRVVNGYVSVNLGSVTAFGSSIPWSQDLYVTMRVGGTGTPSWDTTEMTNATTGRLKVSAVPLAFVANNVRTADRTAAASDNITIKTGNTSTSGNSGSISIDAGTAAGTTGTITLGATSASALTLGRTGLTTSNAGALTVAQLLTGNLGATISGATTNINASSNFATNINTGTSTGAVSIGNSLAGAIALQSASTIGLTGTTSITGLSAGAGTALTVNNSASTGSVFVAQDNGTAVFSIADGGAVLAKNSADSTTAFQVQNAAGTSIFTIDTSNVLVTVNANTVLSAGKYLAVTGGNTASRPASPTEGMIYYDTDTKQLLTYANGKWQGDRVGASRIVAASNSSQFAKDSADYVTNGEDSAGSGIGTLDGDQIEINNALTAVSAAGGGTVYLMEGTYTIDGSISMPNNVTLAGTGNSTLVQLGNFGATSTTVYAIINSDTVTGTGVVLKNFKMDGRRSINTAGTQRAVYFNHMGISSTGSNLAGSEISGITAIDFFSNVFYLDNSELNKITGNTVINGDASGVFLSNSADNNISRNMIEKMTSSAISLNSNSDYNIISANRLSFALDGLFISSSSSENTITGNDINDNTSDGIEAQGFANTISANMIVGNALHGINLPNTSADNTIISGNTVTGNTNNGINITTGTELADITITGNSIQLNGFRNIYINNGTRIGITGNVLWGDSTLNENIYLSATSSSIISGNKISEGGDVTLFDGLYLTASDGNQITGNSFYDSSCTTNCYAINIFDSTSDNNYLSDNTFNAASGTATINDAGTGTRYGGQTTSATGVDMLFKQTNSATALRVQNSAGSSIVNVDTSSNTVSILPPSGFAGVPSWSTSPNTLPAAKAYMPGATANGYAYVVGGSTSTTVYYGKIQANGDISGWASTTALTATRERHATVVANGYIYAIGGSVAGAASSSVIYARVNADGTVGAWNATTSLPAVRNKITNSAVVANGYIYVLGGNSGAAAVQDVYYAKLNSDGTIGSWTSYVSPSTSALPAIRQEGAAVSANGFIYYTGGSDGTTTQTTNYYAALNSTDGTIGAWASTTALSTAKSNHSAVVVNGYLYLIGGWTGSGITGTSVYGPLSSAGTISSWTATTTLPAGRSQGATFVSNGYIYMIGGDGGAGTNTIYYGRAGGVLQVGGSLDLVGSQGQNLVDGGDQSQGSTGGSITAGNIRAVGSLEIQGTANFSQMVNISGELVVGNSYVDTATFSSSLIASSLATTTTGTTSGTGGANVTSITLSAAGSFANGDIILVDNTGGSGQDYYTRITAGGGTTTLTVSPAVSYGTAAGYTGNATITKYNVQNIGAIGTGTTFGLASRFFQGFFTGGVVTGAGSTTLSDQSLMSSGALYLKTNGENTRLTLDTSGNMGIGISPVTSRTLSVGGLVSISAGNRLQLVSSTSSNLWNIDDSAGTLRIFREDFSATGTGANGSVKLSITDAGAATFAGSVTLGSAASDPSPVAGMMYYNSSLAKFRCYQGSQWFDCISGLSTRDEFWARPIGTGWSGAGVGTMSEFGTQVENNTSQYVYTKSTNAGGSGSAAGFRTQNYSMTRLAYNPTCTMQVRSNTSLTTTHRIWIGLVSAAVANSDDAGANYAAFRYSTVAGDTGFRAITDDGTTQNVGGLVTNGTMATNTDYTLKIRVTGGNAVYFSINGGAETLMNTNLPSIDMGFTMQIIDTGTTADTFNFGKFYCEQTQG